MSAPGARPTDDDDDDDDDDDNDDDDNDGRTADGAARVIHAIGDRCAARRAAARDHMTTRARREAEQERLNGGAQRFRDVSEIAFVLSTLQPGLQRTTVNCSKCAIPAKRDKRSLTQTSF